MINSIDWFISLCTVALDIYIVVTHFEAVCVAYIA